MGWRSHVKSVQRSKPLLLGLLLSLLAPLMLSGSASAHLPGQPSFLKINGYFVDYYKVKKPSTDFIDIPQSTDINRHLPGEELSFEIDRKLLAVSNNDAQKMSFDWQFGDGDTGEGVSATHTYAHNGAYTLKIFGTADGKRRLVESSAIFILPDSSFQRPKVYISVNGREVRNDTEQISMPAGQEVTFSAKLVPAEAKADSFKWDFGDGQTATGQTVKHTYAQTYTTAFPVVRATVDGIYYADNSAQLSNPTGGKHGSGPGEWYASAKRAMEENLRQAFGNNQVNYPLVLLILVFAVVAGAFHSLTPGHGKTVLAALLIGKQGSQYKDLGILAGSITIAHTLVIYIVGFTLLGLNSTKSANSLIPYFEKASAALVFILALYLLSSGVRKLIAARRHAKLHAEGHEHDHDYEHGHSHDHGDGHHHHHHAPAFITNLSKRSHAWSLVIAGTGGGIIPCIDALSLMLLAAGLGHPGFGLILVFFFSLGLALTITALGLILLAGKRRFLPSDRYEQKVAIAAPLISGCIILVLAVVLLSQS